MVFIMIRNIVLFLFLALPPLIAHAKVDFSQSRSDTRLTEWTIQTSPDQSPKTIPANDSWEQTLGYEFDGQATYRTLLPSLAVEKSGRVLLHFDAVATYAEVFLDGELIGKHLGGWTAWRIDITDRFHAGAVLSVVVDERPGHNTQGFLPVFLPHFGGIWQPVRLIVTQSASYIDDLTMFAAGWTKDRIEIQAAVKIQPSNDLPLNLGVRILEPVDSRCEMQWREIDEKASATFVIDPKVMHRWYPDDPSRYLVEIVLRDGSGQTLDRLTMHASIRLIETRGRELWLNGNPITVRGVLNWGYAPPRIAPSLDVAFMEREVSMLKGYGFNLMKFCLWFPPQDYFELCDRNGILTWMEYPTWHPKLTQEFLADLRSEYEEFFHADRNHPSIVLRSLTCETGHSAELEVIQSLYDRAHELVPGSVVEDDSSWIGWHRVNDFYDDHPYGNNHTWRENLEKLNRHIVEREPKPLMLGEAIAADTWTTAKAIKAFAMPSNNPNRLHSADHIDSTLEKLRSLTDESSVLSIEADSMRNALAMRKFQIERYRHQMPRQGYVVSVIRDFPFASMGLMNFRDEPKWDESDWQWHNQKLLSLETRNDARSFVSAERVECLVHALELGSDMIPSLKLKGPFGEITAQVLPVTDPANEALSTFKAVMEMPEVNTLTQATIQAQVGAGENQIANQWPIWIVPADDRFESRESTGQVWYHHSSAPMDFLQSITDTSRPNAWSETVDIERSVVIARHFDPPLFDWVMRGGHVILLPDREPGSFPVSDHWFLRGGVVVNRKAIGDPTLSKMISDLQTFDLAGPTMIAPDYLVHVTPWALLWDNHDRKDFQVHALCWLAQMGKGRIAVSTFQHGSHFGAAGPYVLQRIMRDLTSPKPLRKLPTEVLDRMRIDLTIKLVELSKDGWLFTPDKSDRGVGQHWERPSTDRTQWQPIRIGTHWDSQGFGHVDGWAWYAKQVSLAPDARYLTFTGVDDYFELYIDGEKCGTGGDRETRKTAFDQSVTLAIPEKCVGLEKIQIVVRVEDWQGAGGIFRPVFVSNQPPSPAPAILERRKQSD